MAVFDSREKLKALLETPGMDVNPRCNEGMTPFQFQATKGMTPAHFLSFVINYPVLFASEEKYQQALDALGLLIDVGADFSLRDDEGRTPQDILRERYRTDPRVNAIHARLEKRQLLVGLVKSIELKSEDEERRPMKRRLM